MAAAGRSRESQRSSRRVVEYRGSKDRCAASGSPGAPLVLRGGVCPSNLSRARDSWGRLTTSGVSNSGSSSAP